MRGIGSGLAIVVLLAMLPVTQAQSNFCMDCIEKQVQHWRPDNSTWFESDGMCCMVPCYGYTDYEVDDEDVGSGCNTTPVSNDFLQGDICSSTLEDQGCPEPPPPPGGGDEQDDGTGCDDPNRVGCGSPILIDLGKQSYRLTSISDGVWFDLKNEGAARRVAWTRAGIENAFLAMDRNGNGRIDNGSELFGDSTPLRSGQNAQHGFEVLRELDENGDGLVDRNDSAWASLLLWTDRNHDGQSSSDELEPISQSAVKGLETNCEAIGRRDQWGNAFRFLSHVRFEQGKRAYYDVYLKLSL